MANEKLVTAENRNELEFFVADPSKNHKDGDYIPFVFERGSIFFPGNEVYMEGCKFIYYIAPLDSHNGLLFLYLGNNSFDELKESLNKYTIQVAKETWPLLMEALSNGENNNPSELALTKFDIGSCKFWATCMKLDNIDYSDLETEYIGYRVGLLIGRTSSMLKEYLENDISSFQKIKIGAKVGADLFVTSKRLLNIASYLFG